MDSKTAPRAYSYRRFSTPEQSKGDSLRRQTALADEYAKRHGLTLDTELNLNDLGVSAFRGDNLSTGALGLFLKAVHDGLVPQGSFLLVESLDRISRKAALAAVNVVDQIAQAGITVVTLNDGKQYNAENMQGMDALIAFVVLMRAHDESNTKAKRLKASWIAKRERAARGDVLTSSVPAWIHVEGSAAKDARDAKLSLIPERAALVRRMFEMFTAGAGKSSIAETFNAEGLPTWGGKRNGRTAAHWHKTYVFKILTSPAVTGRFTPFIETHEAGRKVRTAQPPIEGYFPRVVDDVTFARVQRLIKDRTKTVRRPAAVASILAGLARCPKCGATMTRVSKGSGDRAGVPKLVCTKAKAGAGCEYRSVKLPEVEGALVAAAAQIGNPPVADNDLAASVAGMGNELVELELQIEALVDAIEQSPSAALSKRLAAREAEADKLRLELRELEQRAADSESKVVNHRAKRLADSLKRLKSHPDEIAAANAALRECVDSVAVDYEVGALLLKWRHGAETSIQYRWFEAIKGA